MSIRFLCAALLFAVTAVVACGERADVKEAQGAVRVRLPIVGPDGVEEIGERTLVGIEDLSEVRGRYARFYHAPKVTAIGLVGFGPRARFLRDAEGVFIPANQQTQHLASLYWEMQNLAELDRETGADGLLKWPRKIGISARIKNGSELWTNNAFFDGPSDSILLVPYRLGRLPLANNPGVVGHEHFHSLFDKAIVRPLLEKGVISRLMQPSIHDEGIATESFENTRDRAAEGETKPATDGENDRRSFERLSTTVLVKVLNEGLADVWGWVHSGDYDFVRRSLPHEKGRLLQAESGNVSLLARSELRDAVASAMRNEKIKNRTNEYFNAWSYQHAASFARVVIEVFSAGTETSDPKARRELGRRVVKALPEIARLIETGGDELDVPSAFRALAEAAPLSDEQKKRAEPWLATARTGVLLR